MKQLFYILMAIGMVMGIVSCSKEAERQKWEYRTLVSEGINFGDYGPKTIIVPDAKLDSLGKEGWELVDVYTAVETVHPNFGNAKYVTGLQPNMRTSNVYYVFKRQFNEKDTTKHARVETESIEIVYKDTI